MTRFLQSNRSDIGLVDRFDLSEIYTQDSRFALSNILLDPNGLDQIFGLSSDGLTREDIRTTGGLDRPVIHSLGIADRMLSAVSFDLSQRATTDKAVGEPGKHSFTTNSRSDNVIVFSGGIAAEKIEYNFLDQNGEVRTTTVPTSRESLFDSIKDSAGRFTTASYPGLFRIRRRSHVNQIKLDPSLLIEKNIVIESPTDLVNLPIYMRTSTNTNPNVTLLSAYATKNSPIVLPVRINSTGSISFSRKTANASSPPFVYGWELRRFSDGTLVRGQSVNSKGNIVTVNISINVTGTIGAGVNCLLYVYLDPEQVSSANLSSIGLTEVLGGQDIGLIGFNNLEDINLSGNNLSTLPVWLKTLYSKLISLNIRANSYWNNGIVSFFDYQDLRTAGITGANTSIDPPNITISQVLGYSGWSPSGTKISGYDGDFSKVQDTSGRLYMDSRANSISGTTPATINLQNGFRPFSQITDLNLGSSIRLVNPDFSKLFPRLRNLTIDREDDKSPAVYWGLIPKLNNNKALMSINIEGHEEKVGGSIKYLGDTLEWDSSNVSWTTEKADQFIGQFQITNFNISRRNTEGQSIGTGFFGGICTDSSDVTASVTDGMPRYHHVTSGTVEEAWGGWLSRLQQIRMRRNDVAFKVARGTGLLWNNLRVIDITWMGNYGTRNKVEYNRNLGAGDLQAIDVLNAPLLTNIEAYSCGWWGKIFSIEGANSLTRLQIGANDWRGYSGNFGEEYLFPSNFTINATSDSFSNLQEIRVDNLIDGATKNIELRPSDLQNLPKLTRLFLIDSYIGGVFPSIPNNSLTQGVTFNCWLRNSRFRDLRALGSSVTNRVGLIWAPLQGSGVGGSLLPVFAPLGTNSTLNYVLFNNSLNSRYPSNWGDSTRRGTVIASLASGQTPESVTPVGITWTSRNNNNTADANSSKLYHSAPGTYFPSQEILVGDDVILGNAVIGRVTQIDRSHAFIYIDTNVDIVLESLTFRRRGQNISTYFNNHFNLAQVYLDDCRLVGDIPTFEGCTLGTFISMNNNILSGYVAGTLKNITGVSINTLSAPRLRLFSITNNALSVSSIRTIISDLHDIAVYFTQRNIRTNIRVRLLGTKLNTSTRQYQNWTRSEIFNQTSTSGDGNQIPDSLETKFNQMGPGALYPGITIELF